MTTIYFKCIFFSFFYIFIFIETGDNGTSSFYGRTMGALFGAISDTFENRSAIAASGIVEGVVFVKLCTMERTMGFGNFI